MLLKFKKLFRKCKWELNTYKVAVTYSREKILGLSICVTSYMYLLPNIHRYVMISKFIQSSLWF